MRRPLLLRFFLLLALLHLAQAQAMVAPAAIVLRDLTITQTTGNAKLNVGCNLTANIAAASSTTP